MSAEILNMELSQEDEKLLRESLTTWKEGVYADLLEDVEELKVKKIEELEEANRQYQEELKESFANKMIVALNEMKESLRAEVVSEMVASNPELQILEKIKELVAPTLNEEFYGNVYAEEIITLREENENLKREQELDEGAAALADLISPYSKKTREIILSVIKEGNAEEVTEQFYELIESLESINEDDDDDDFEDDDDDFEDDDDDFNDDDDFDDDDLDEGSDDHDSYIKEGEEGGSEDDKKKNSFLNDIARLAK